MKSIETSYRTANQRFSESVITVTLSDPPGAESPHLNYLHDDWEDRFETPRTPVASDTLHQDLRRAYDEVHYVVGVRSPSWAEDDGDTGCRNATAGREDFNQVQVHDEVTASFDDDISVHSVDGTWPVGEY